MSSVERLGWISFISAAIGYVCIGFGGVVGAVTGHLAWHEARRAGVAVPRPAIAGLVLAYLSFVVWAAILYLTWQSIPSHA